MAQKTNGINNKIHYIVIRLFRLRISVYYFFLFRVRWKTKYFLLKFTWKNWLKKKNVFKCCNKRTRPAFLVISFIFNSIKYFRYYCCNCRDSNPLLNFWSSYYKNTQTDLVTIYNAFSNCNFFFFLDRRLRSFLYNTYIYEIYVIHKNDGNC